MSITSHNKIGINTNNPQYTLDLPTVVANVNLNLILTNYSNSFGSITSSISDLFNNVVGNQFQANTLNSIIVSSSNLYAQNSTIANLVLNNTSLNTLITTLQSTCSSLQTSIASINTSITSINTSISNFNIPTLSNSYSNLLVSESTGTVPTPNNGSITLQHSNSNGTSSIVFKSANNTGSDSGWIQFIDNVNTTQRSFKTYNYFNGISTEAAALVIGCGDDGSNEYGPDSVILKPTGNVVLAPTNNLTYIQGFVGINNRNPGATLDVFGPEDLQME